MKGGVNIPNNVYMRFFNDSMKLKSPESVNFFMRQSKRFKEGNARKLKLTRGKRYFNIMADDLKIKNNKELIQLLYNFFKLNPDYNVYSDMNDNYKILRNNMNNALKDLKGGNLAIRNIRLRGKINTLKKNTSKAARKKHKQSRPKKRTSKATLRKNNVKKQ